MLPPGVTLSAAGVLSGTPTTAGRYAFTVVATNGQDEARQDAVVEIALPAVMTTGTITAIVPATLALTIGAPATFGAFAPGLAKDYTASTDATVTSSAGDAPLTVSDPGHLANGAFELASPLVVELSKTTWTAPVANDPVTITFKQHVGASDALRTGGYSKTLTFTLSTTTP